MPKSSRNVAQRRMAGRLWSFGEVTFDEGSWSLRVSGTRVQLEQKPMELLHELLLNAGKTVSKDDLLERVWSDVTVVEASLPTAMLKLRRAIGDTDRAHPMIETVAKIGYSLVTPVTVIKPEPAPDHNAEPQRLTFGRRASDQTGPFRPWNWPILAGMGVAIGGAFLALGQFDRSNAAPAVQPGAKAFSNQEVHNAVKRLDVVKVDAMLAAGWDPSKPLDKWGSTPLTLTLEVCEWNPAHDREKMVMIARALLDKGAKLDYRNYYGDTAYSIARAKRFCGLDHPATILIRSLCINRQRKVDESCLALRNGKLEY